MDYSGKDIIEGTLSVEGEQQYYDIAKRNFVKVLAKTHNFDLEKPMPVSEVYRFIGFIDSETYMNLPEFEGANKKVIIGTAITVKRQLIENIDKMPDHVNQGLNLGVLFKFNDR